MSAPFSKSLWVTDVFQRTSIRTDQLNVIPIEIAQSPVDKINQFRNNLVVFLNKTDGVLGAQLRFELTDKNVVTDDVE